MKRQHAYRLIAELPNGRRLYEDDIPPLRDIARNTVGVAVAAVAAWAVLALLFVVGP